VVVLPDPFRGMGAWRNSTGDPTVEPHPKVWTRGQRWRAGEAQMQDDPGGGESDPVEGVRWRCKKNSFILSCIGTRTGEGCDRDSEVGTFQADETEKAHTVPTSRRLNVVVRSPPSLERWAEMARQLPRGVRLSGYPQSSGMLYVHFPLERCKQFTLH